MRAVDCVFAVPVEEVKVGMVVVNRTTKTLFLCGWHSVVGGAKPITLTSFQSCVW